MSKRPFFVNVREVHIQTYRVEADDEESAKEAVSTGEGKVVEDLMEFSHTLDDSEDWTVEEVKNDVDNTLEQGEMDFGEEVTALINRGLSNEEIVDHLSLDPHTREENLVALIRTLVVKIEKHSARIHKFLMDLTKSESKAKDNQIRKQRMRRWHRS